MHGRVLRFSALSLMIMLSLAWSAGAAHSSAVVVYLDENGSLCGYMHPDATDPMSALGLLASPPSMEVTGKLLTSAVLPGTRVLDLKVVDGVAVVNFSGDIVGAELDELRLTNIFEQVKSTLFQFGMDGDVKVLADGSLLSEYVPAPKPVEPSPEALREQALRTPPILGVAGLAGKKITLSPGHGKRWNGSSWNTARPVYCSPL
ncbi:MAG: GerMN domain-containing protein, partial [Armatimonadetes bacterium]|nr:GerMN domain-containing protein [Armatimonadota bacterium]